MFGKRHSIVISCRARGYAGRYAYFPRCSCGWTGWSADDEGTARREGTKHIQRKGA